MTVVFSGTSQSALFLQVENYLEMATAAWSTTIGDLLICMILKVWSSSNSFGPACVKI